MKKAVWIGAPLALLLVAQLVPAERSNPPTEGEVPATAEQREVLRRACYDCHSHETRWAWYSRVAPVSWLVARDVEEGREHVNFSTWDRYDAEERAESLEESWEMVEEGADEAVREPTHLQSLVEGRPALEQQRLQLAARGQAVLGARQAVA